MPDDKAKIGQDKRAHGARGLASSRPSSGQKRIRARARKAGPSYCGRDHLVMSRLASGLNRGSPRTRSPVIFRRSLSSRTYCKKNGSMFFLKSPASRKKPAPSRRLRERLNATNSLKRESPSPAKVPVDDHMPQGIDDERQIAQPMEEIVGVRVPGAERGRSQYWIPARAGSFGQTRGRSLTRCVAEIARSIAAAETSFWRAIQSSKRVFSSPGTPPVVAPAVAIGLSPNSHAGLKSRAAPARS